MKKHFFEHLLIFFFSFNVGITMTDGPEWREMRAWLVRSLKNLGFGGEEMSDRIKDELEIIIEKLRSQNAQVIQMKPIIAPAVINVIWGLATGKRIVEESRYVSKKMRKKSK